MFKLLRATIGGQSHPVIATISVTGRCNARCLYCFGTYHGDDPTLDPSTEQLITLIDDLISRGTAFIAFTGGEPLLRDDLGLLISHVKSKGCLCGLDTNGFLIPQRIGELSNLDTISICLDGEELVHDTIRGTGSYRKAIKGLEVALEHGVKVEIGTVLNRQTIHSVDYMVDFARSKGCQVKFFPLRYFDNRWKTTGYENLIPRNEEFKEVFNRIRTLKKEGAPIRYSERGLDFILNWPDYSRAFWIKGTPDFPYVRCRAGRLRCFVEYNGGVYPCCDLINSFPAKNYLEVGLKEALRHAAEANTCRTCYFPSQVEQNLMVSLDWRVIISNIRATLKK